MIDKLLEQAVRVDRCLEWTGSLSKGIPVARVPGWRDLMAVRRMVLLEQGPIEPGKLASTTCGNRLCINPAHVRPMTRKMVQRKTAQVNPYHKNPVRSAKIAAKAKARRVLDDATAEAIRLDPRPLRVIAKELGVSFSVPQMIRSGKTYREAAGNPWGGLFRP